MLPRREQPVPLLPTAPQCWEGRARAKASEHPSVPLGQGRGALGSEKAGWVSVNRW